MAHVLIPLAQGCEELEAVTLIDLLRRAGITVTTASLDTQTVQASRGVKLLADCVLDDVLETDFDMIILPGGQPGTNNLNQSNALHELIQQHYGMGKAIAAICAAPLVLAHAGILNGKKATCFPGVLTPDKWPSIDLLDQATVIDGQVFTSKGPGTAMDFALSIIEFLTNSKTKDDVERGLVRS